MQPRAVLFAALLAIGAAVNFKQEASNVNSQAISFAEGGNVRACGRAVLCVDAATARCRPPWCRSFGRRSVSLRTL
jgi:hypothetical protein